MAGSQKKLDIAVRICLWYDGVAFDCLLEESRPSGTNQSRPAYSSETSPVK